MVNYCTHLYKRHKVFCKYDKKTRFFLFSPKYRNWKEYIQWRNSITWFFFIFHFAGELSLLWISKEQKTIYIIFHCRNDKSHISNPILLFLILGCNYNKKLVLWLWKWGIRDFPGSFSAVYWRRCFNLLIVWFYHDIPQEW